MNVEKKQVYLNLNNDIVKFLKDRFNRLKRGANHRNIKFNLTFKYYLNLFQIQKGKCFYTNILMKCNVGTGLQRNSLSMDKIIPTKGYVKNNVVFCIHKVNSVKSDLSMNELKLWIPNWYNKIQKRSI